MSHRRRKELIFAIAYSIMTVFFFIAGIAAENPGALLFSGVALIVALISWVQYAALTPSKPAKPVPKTAAQLEQEKADAEQREAVRQERLQSYRAKPVPLLLKQHDRKFGWNWQYKCKDIKPQMAITMVGSDELGISDYVVNSYTSVGSISFENGAWHITCKYGTRINVNSPGARARCTDMQCNEQAFSITSNQKRELLPGDCFTVVSGNRVGYFRVEEKTGT